MSDVTPTPAQPANSLLKDLLIPLSIVIAGAFVGVGLYFGGAAGSSAPGSNSLTVSGGEPPADTTSKIDPVTADDHVKGNRDAKIMIVEYSDYDCPFCSRFHDTMKVVTEKYGENIGWVYRHFPLEQLHPQAPAVALAAECVAELGGNDAFWKFTDDYVALRGSGDKTPHDTLIPQLVVEAGVNQAAFTECFNTGRHVDAVEADMADAVETGGRGTPWSILIGPDGKTYPINGAQSAPVIEQLIESVLSEA